MSDQSTLGGGTVSENEIEKKKERATANDPNPLCEECGEEKEYVNEPMMSGTVGYFCMTDGCPIDG